MSPPRRSAERRSAAWCCGAGRSVRRERGPNYKLDSRLRGNDTDPLHSFENLLSQFKGRKWEGIDFFTGGAVVCLSYELANQFEKLPSPFEKGDKVSQLVIVPVEIVELIETDTLSESARGEGRFGSTGKK